jgi:hypothetical protein
MVIRYRKYSKAVDQADQLRGYYSSGTHRQHEGWRALFTFLLDTLLCNAYLLSTYQYHHYAGPEESPHRRPHREFLIDLAADLLAQAKPRIKRGRPFKSIRAKSEVVRAIPREHGRWPKKLDKPPGECLACLRSGRVAKAAEDRKILGKLDPNRVATESRGSDIKCRVKRTPRTAYGCPLCQVHLCQKWLCWEEHMIMATQTTPKHPICID